MAGAAAVSKFPASASVTLGTPATVLLPNSIAVLITALSLTTFLETQTASSEDSSMTLAAMRAGTLTDLVKFSGKSNQWPIEIKATNASVQGIAFTNGDAEITNTQATKYLFMGTLGSGAAGLYGAGQIGLVVQGSGSSADCALGTNVALANNATLGFAHMPRCETTGVMTGTPAFQTGFFNHKAAFCFNSVDSTINVWNGAAWKRTVALT